MRINDTTPEQWDALRKKKTGREEPCGSELLDKYEKFLEERTIDEEYLEYPSVDEEQCMVENPPHYNAGGIECIEAIKASMSTESYTGYLKGNVQKYVWRYEDKNGVEDLRKAQWYLNTLIDVLWEE